MKIFITLFLFLAASVQGLARELVIGITPANGAPYVVGDFANIDEGLIYDISTWVTEQTGIRFRFSVLPRARIEPYLLDGRIDVITFFNPNWTSNDDKYWFSEPVFTEGNIIVTRQDDAFQPTQWSDLTGPIGGHRGYVYPAPFNEAVASGRVFRDDVEVPKQNYMKLHAHRINGFILSDIIYAYDLKANKELTANTKASEWRLTENTIHWLMLKDHPDAEQVITAINRLVTNGGVEQLLQTYR